MPHLSDRTKPEAITRTTGPSSLPFISGFSLYPFLESVFHSTIKTIPTLVQHTLGALPTVVDVFSTVETITTLVQHIYLDIRVNNLLQGMEGVPKGICRRITMCIVGSEARTTRALLPQAAKQ